MLPRRSIVQRSYTPDFEAPKSVPFVELHEGRIQGVVASSSSNERVYVSYVEADSGNFYCRTNNNRRCAGLRDDGCKHIGRLVAEAMARYPPERVREYVGVDPNSAVATADQIVVELGGVEEEGDDSQVFSRFRDYMMDLEREPTSEPLPEMAWFVS